MKTTHTKGHWHFDSGQIYTEITGRTLALIPHFDETDAEQGANIKLIAAAPELLGALTLLLAKSECELDQSSTHDGLNNCDALAKARASIEKAQG